jgi:Ca-activated chloride channel homolog
LVLITDGIESCEGNPCEVSLQLQKKGIMLNPYIIGIGMNKSEVKTFDCVGRFYDANNPKAFLNYAQDIMEQIVNITSAEVQLLDDFGKPSESNVPVTFYDHTTGKIRYKFIHTLNQRGKPDTLSIDPVSLYDMVVHTSPAVVLYNVKLNPDVHNQIKVKAPTGNLEVKIDGLSEKFSFQYIIKPEMNDTMVAYSETGKGCRILTGRYDVEVFCLPRINVNVEVAQSKTTTINIPAPGIYTILNAATVPIIGSIFEEKGDKLYWLSDVNGRSKSESLVLQPGNYRFVYRAKASKKMQSSRDVSFRIAPGASETYKIVF